MTAVMRVWMDGASFHTASFFQLTPEGKIVSLDEYFGDDGEAPEWRQKMALPSRFAKGRKEHLDKSKSRVKASHGIAICCFAARRRNIRGMRTNDKTLTGP